MTEVPVSGTAGNPDGHTPRSGRRRLGFEAIPIFGLDPDEHLKRCRELASQGYRMVSLSVARTSPEHRRSPPRSGTARWSAKRRRTGWPAPGSGRDCLDPHGRGERGLAALAAQRRPPAEELHHQLAESAGRRSEDDRRRARPTGFSRRPPTQPPATRSMDAILFHPETSIRRALILALGTYGPTLSLASASP